MFERFTWLIFIALALTGCSYLPEADSIKSSLDFTTPKDAKISIQTTPQSNCGKPFHVIVKATTFSEFLVDNYDKIAPLISNPDENCLIIRVSPRTKLKPFPFNCPPDKSIAIYALFTYPGEGWKQIFERPAEGKMLKIRLAERDIISFDN